MRTNSKKRIRTDLEATESNSFGRNSTPQKKKMNRSKQRSVGVLIVVVVSLFVVASGEQVLETAEDGVEPRVEFRGLYLATVWNIDWPKSGNEGVAEQREELLNYLDMMKETKMNALIFQVRPAGDAFYASAIEPWSRFLTGAQGKSPSPFWDPLEFAVEEAHRRSIQLHVWLNPYRANLSPDWNGLAPNHVAIRHRRYAHPYGKLLWMDPAAEPVADQLIDVIKDILSRYSVDGVLFDDYFYPYPSGGVPFPDNDTYSAYLDAGGRLPRDDWRRENVNRLIQRVRRTIDAVRPRCSFGISPFGLYRPGQAEGMPAPIRGFDPYSGTFADSKLWLQRGWVDYLSPQLYWTIDAPHQSYPVALDWWLDQNTASRNIFVSNAVYKIADWSVSEITDQISLSRDQGRRDKRSLGNILFSAKWFRDNSKNTTDVFRRSVYTHRAAVPRMRSLQTGSSDGGRRGHWRGRFASLAGMSVATSLGASLAGKSVAP